MSNWNYLPPPQQYEQAGGYPPQQQQQPLNYQPPYQSPYPPSVDPTVSYQQQPQLQSHKHPESSEWAFSYIDPNDSGNLRLWFERIDTNRNGVIDAQELQQVLEQMTGDAYPQDTVDMMIMMFDEDSNGTIDYDEFQALAGYLKTMKTEFYNSDTTRSGSIDEQQLERALSPVNERGIGTYLGGAGVGALLVPMIQNFAGGDRRFTFMSFLKIALAFGIMATLLKGNRAKPSSSSSSYSGGSSYSPYGAPIGTYGNTSSQMGGGPKSQIQKLMASFMGR